VSFRRFFDGDLSRRVTPYSDPYVSIAQYNIPPSIKAMMNLCRRLYLTDSTVAPTVWKISNYPITDLKIEASTPAIRRDWDVLYGPVLKVKRFNQLLNLDYNALGNGMGSLVFPFDKWLICPRCNKEQQARNAKYRFNKDGFFAYSGNCPGCKRNVHFEVEDRDIKRAWNRLALLRWPPMTIDIDFQPYGGGIHKNYFHRIPKEVRAAIHHGNHLYTSTLPIDFIQAARTGRRVKINGDNFFHMARPTVSADQLAFGPWGMPLIMPVVKDVFTMNILIKAQEAMAQNRILPLRMIWPLMGNQPAPVGGINLGNWRSEIERMVKIWLRDPNYVGITPIPVGMGTLGADARPMLLNQEISALAEKVVVGMGVPKGFVFGDLQFSSASVTLRMIENEMLSSRVELQEFNDNFLKTRIQTYMDWPSARISFTKLRMADDIQKLNLLMQLNAAGKISDRDFLAEFEYDADEQARYRKNEIARDQDIARINARSMAEAQGIAAIIAAHYNFEAQQVTNDLAQQAQEVATLDQMTQQSMGIREPTPQETMEGAFDQQAIPSAMPVGQQVNIHARELAGMSPADQQAMLQRMRVTNPAYADAVGRMAQGQGPQAVDMRPNSEILPPRRESPMI
jgi:hypothetical protein